MLNLELGVDAHCNLDLELSALNGKIVYYGMEIQLK